MRFPSYKPHLWFCYGLWRAGFTRETGAVAFGFTAKEAWEAFMRYTGK